MGKIFLASAAILALTCQSQAGDGKIDWAGSYLGIEAGVGFSRPGFSGEDTLSGSDFDDTGFVGGIFVGHDWRHEHWVYGISGHFDGLDFDNQVAQYAPDPIFGGKTDSYDLNWVASLRGRAGYLVTDNFLIYGTGGVAVTQVRTAAQGSGTLVFDPVLGFTLVPGEVERNNATRVGGVFGAGMEYAINSKWSFRTEYVHYLFGKVGVGGGSSGADKVNFNPSFGTLMVGVSYHF
jgi:opacity protein-like surface antigen